MSVQPPPIPQSQSDVREFKVYGLETKFYGRREALETLFSAIKKSVNQRSIQVVSVSGNSGVGKTRLVHEYTQLIDVETRGMRLLMSDSVEGESELSFRCADQLLRARFKIRDDMSAEEARGLISNGLGGILDASQVLEATRLLSHWVGLPLPRQTVPDARFNGESFQKRALNTLVNLFKFDCSQRPHILVFDNYHLAPLRTREVISAFIEGFQGTATVVIVAGLRIDNEDWSGVCETTEIALEPLEASAMNKVLRHLLRRVHELSDEFVMNTVGKAAGNPALLEDIVRVMLQRGVITDTGERWELVEKKAKQASLPETIADAARARTEALGAEQRRVLEIASVFGSVFWFKGVLSVARSEATQDASAMPEYWYSDKSESRINILLLGLQGQDLIDFRPDSGISEEVCFSFVNAIEQQRLYTGIEKERRAHYHRLAGQWLEQVVPQGNRQVWELIARHSELGGEMRSAATAYKAAADCARERYQNRRAIDLYSRALEFCDGSTVVLSCYVYRSLAELYVTLGEYENSELASRDLLRHSSIIVDRHWGGVAYHRLGIVARCLGDYPTAIEYLQRGLKLYQEEGDSSGIADCMDEMGLVHWYRGDYGSHREALGSFMKALSLRRKEAEPTKMAQSLTHIADIHLARGHVAEAAESFEESLVLRRAEKDEWGMAESLLGTGAIHYVKGRNSDARGDWEEGVKYAAGVGDRRLFGALQNKLGEVNVVDGKHQAAEQHTNKAYECAIETGDKRMLSESLRNKGILACKRKLYERALELLDDANTAAKSVGGKQLVGSNLWARGDVLADIVANQGEAEVPDIEDFDKEASESYQRAITYFEEMGDKLRLASAMQCYGNFLVKRGVVNKGRKLLERAESVLEHVAG